MSAPKIPEAVAFYLRVSTEEQNHASQLHALAQFCKRSGWQGPGASLVFADKISGKKAKRTQLDRLMQAARGGLFDCLLVYSISRIGRNAAHTYQVIAEMETLRIRIVSVSDNIDTAINSGNMAIMKGVLIGVAEGNGIDIVSAIRAGLAARRAKGLPMGRPRMKGQALAAAVGLRNKFPAMGLREIARKVGINPGYLCRYFKGRVIESGKMLTLSAVKKAG